MTKNNSPELMSLSFALCMPNFRAKWLFSSKNHLGSLSILLLFIIKLWLTAGNGIKLKIFSWKFSFWNVLWISPSYFHQVYDCLREFLEQKCYFWLLIGLFFITHRLKVWSSYEFMIYCKISLIKAQPRGSGSISWEISSKLV